jgi:hypothetical protein
VKSSLGTVILGDKIEQEVHVLYIVHGISLFVQPFPLTINVIVSVLEKIAYNVISSET